MLRVAVGKPFEIELESNPTTGYRWDATFAPDDLRLVRSEQVPAGRRIGAGGRQRLVFEALRPGRFTLSVAYKRPWDQTAAEHRQFTVNAG